MKFERLFAKKYRAFLPGKLQTSTYQGISNVPRVIMLIAIIITLPFQPVRVVPLLAVPVPVQTVQFHNKSVHYPLKSFIKCVNDSVKLGSNQQRKKKGLTNEKDITHKAKEKHASFDQSFDQAVEYVLLYPDFREVKLIPGTTQPFILCDYRDAIGKDYKRLTFYLIPVEELLDNSDDSDGEVPKTVSSSFDIRHYGFTPIGATFGPVEQSFTSDSLTHFETEHTVRRNSNASTSSASSGELILNAYHYQRAKAILQMSFKLNEVKQKKIHAYSYIFFTWFKTSSVNY